mmetsp:Transcript_27854/g.38367  ORF Transcript_27854/g.38367 Transcript_27854/m.38367 type:complete len:81 (-) Transcript_27854:121-363(-)
MEGYRTVRPAYNKASSARHTDLLHHLHCSVAINASGGGIASHRNDLDHMAISPNSPSCFVVDPQQIFDDYYYTFVSFFFR